jgi:DNA-directed RNA polymerase subunit RPC12/RpoP
MAALQEYKCPCCSGKIEFDPSLQKMKCPYCDTEFELETLQQYDDVLTQDTGDDMNWGDGAGSEWQEGETEGMRVYSCKSCGGEVIGDDTLAATSCPYCGNPIVMMGQFSGDLKPDLVIPFKLDKKAAKLGLAQHLMGKRLLPKVFKDQNHIDEIKGIYVPFWLFDADVDAKIRYRCTKVREWSDSNYNYRETSYYNVFRSGEIAFDRVPVDGTTKIEHDLMESVEPYNYSDLSSFQTAYLAGYLADRYDITATDSVGRANERIKNSTEDAFKTTIKGFDSVNQESSSISFTKSSTKYALLPVWILNTSWNGENYVFAMNGQTGKFVGNLPMDKGAYLRWLFGVAATVAAAAFAFIHFVL